MVMNDKKLQEKLDVLAGSSSKFFHENESNKKPYFDRKEIHVGKLLGVGGFCDVSEICNFNLNNHGQDMEKRELPMIQRGEYNDVNDSDDVSNGDCYDYMNRPETRVYMSENLLRGRDARYAIKMLRKDLDMAVRQQGKLDLAIEVKFLEVISHPNIVKMRGISSGEAIQNDYFLILDRLYETLEEKISNEWAQEHNLCRVSFILGCRKSKKKIARRKDFLIKRIVVALDLACALRYLHQNLLIYRDIKSENIGFDVRGDVKLFDFGLCKEIPSDPRKRCSGNLYKMTGRTGSRHYMAPEVALSQPYNQSADTFSFGILLWEILSLKPPFETFDGHDYIEKVAKSGYRPSVRGDWPAYARSLVKDCWSENIKKRPNFHRITSILQTVLDDLAHDDSNKMRRSGYMMNKSKASRHNRCMTSKPAHRNSDKR